MGSNTKNMPDQKTIEYMLSFYNAAEPYDYDDPRFHLVDGKDDEQEKRIAATGAKMWLESIGYFETITAE